MEEEGAGGAGVGASEPAEAKGKWGEVGEAVQGLSQLRDDSHPPCCCPLTSRAFTELGAEDAVTYLGASQASQT